MRLAVKAITEEIIGLISRQTKYVQVVYMAYYTL